MKLRLLLIAFSILYLGYSQVPANYYDSATGLTGYTLKTELKNIISNGHVDQGYSALYTAYQTTDNDSYYENDNTVLDMYSENPTGADSYNYAHDTNGGNAPGDACGNVGNTEGGCYNREHLFPQGFFNSLTPMRTDVHHVVPTDGYVNGQRGSFPFGEVNTPTDTYSNGSRRGPSATTGYSGTVFEPIDEFKGDIARALLYFATRYEDEVTSNTWDNPNAVPENPLDGSNDQVYETWFVNLLVNWHNGDPVSQREIDRNNASYNFQGNANPFIDHPEYVGMIWVTDTEAPTAPTNLIVSNETSNSIDLSWTASTDNIGVTAYDVYVDGSFNKTVSTTNTTITGLTPQTTYAFTVLAKDLAGNSSAQSTSVNGTTTAGSGNSNVLFISEYIEGSSNNKAIEIANFTGASVSLSDYELRLSSNGNASWTATYTFPNGSSIADNDVFVIAHTSFALTCSNLGSADDSNSSITGFNGNDAIGLFKNNTLIDILGTLGNGSNYAQNTTLVRKETITSPNTVYDANEWNSFALDNCDDLGTHTVTTLSVDDIKPQQFSIYPNPSNGTIFIDSKNVSEDIEVKVFDITGKLILISDVSRTKQRTMLIDLPKGMLLIELTTSQKKVIHKVIVQ
ncbi:endonuclease [Aquimarina sp. 2201CG5-10]|uniref:endonuclease n=1 Tax=Aquimarina callyspongiae TaxID=3098150 RepID=UPI002AB58418|nr:endonuclease [Aquimarina sp. 2201CG5-10]MDY8137248.1 endonuclease [Aquimarina sp. 2201CG5-10]